MRNRFSPSLRSAQIKLHHWVDVLPVRQELHIARKIWHMSMGFIIASTYISGMPQSQALSILGVFFLITIFCETVRLRNPVINEKFLKFFSPVIRTNEVYRPSGVSYFLASSIFAIAVFPKPVAVLSILYLALADPMAALIGVLYKGRSVELVSGKSLHGTLAAFLVCAITTWFFLRSLGEGSLNLLRLTLLGGFAGALAELLPLDIDDNFTIPIVSGFILWLGYIAIQFI